MKKADMLKENKRLKASRKRSEKVKSFNFETKTLKKVAPIHDTDTVQVKKSKRRAKAINRLLRIARVI